jgi:hypothetical protein
MTSMRMAFHHATGRRMVEVFDDRGQFVGSIYPTENGSNSIHIVSKYFGDYPFESSGEGMPPGYLVRFKER